MSVLGFEVTHLCRAIGILGSVIYVGGFAALQMHWIESKGPIYSLSKILGAFFILISLSVDFNLAAALTQFCFLGFGLVGLILRLKSRVDVEQRPEQSPYAESGRSDTRLASL